jgi:hypothetical protein
MVVSPEVAGGGPATGTAGTTGTGGPAVPFLRANRVCLSFTALTVLLTVAVLAGLPPQRELTSLWTMLAMLAPFVAATVAIGWIDLDWAQRLRLHLILPPACFLAFFCYFVPKIFYYAGVAEDFDGLYVTVLLLVPFVILTLALTLRLGGARTATVVKLAVALLLLQLSGIEDLAFLTVNDLSGTEFSPIPEVWTWADHMAVRLGHPPTRTEAYVFIAVHLTVAVAVLATPDRVYRAAGRAISRATSQATSRAAGRRS